MNESELHRCAKLVGKLAAMGVSLKPRRNGAFGAHWIRPQSRHVCMELLGGDFASAKAFMTATKIEVIESLMDHDKRAWSEIWPALDLINEHLGEEVVPWLSQTRDAVRVLFDTMPSMTVLMGRSDGIVPELRNLLLDMEMFVVDQAAIMVRIDRLVFSLG